MEKKILINSGEIGVQSTCGTHHSCCIYNPKCYANWSYAGAGKPLRMSCNC